MLTTIIGVLLFIFGCIVTFKAATYYHSLGYIQFIVEWNDMLPSLILGIGSIFGGTALVALVQIMDLLDKR